MIPYSCPLLSLLMSKIFDTIPDGITWRDLPCIVVLRLVAYKREAPGSKEDISGVSAKGTMMLKSAMGTDEQAYKQSLSKAKLDHI